MFIHRLNTAIFLRAGTLAITAAALTSATSVSAMSAEEARAETQRIAMQYEQTMAHCRTLLTGYKMPARIEFRDELPKTPVGKILRRDLRAEVLGAQKNKT